jgi:glycogen(starch) synthase
MRILHILDHSIPLHSGYTFRTAAILREQRALGWETFHLTSPKQGETKSMVEEVEGLRFHRTAIPAPARSGIAELRQIAAVQARIEQLAVETQARHPACALAGAQCHSRHPCRAQARDPGRL